MDLLDAVVREHYLHVRGAGPVSHRPNEVADVAPSEQLKRIAALHHAP